MPVHMYVYTYVGTYIRTYTTLAIIFSFQRAQFGLILMAIDNISEKCHRHTDPHLETLNLDGKLGIIKVNKNAPLDR